MAMPAQALLSLSICLQPYSMLHMSTTATNIFFITELTNSGHTLIEYTKNR